MIELNHLPNSQPSEQVKVFLRRHWIEVLRIAVLTGFMLLIPIGGLVLLEIFNANIFQHPVGGPVVALIVSSYVLIVYSITLTEITDYWLDVWIVTNERILNAEQHGLFNRVVSEVHLEQIQDVTSETKGLLETFLTYGDVYIQTAAERERFQFKNIDNPDDVKISISQLVIECKNTHHHSPNTISPGLGAPSTSQHAPANINLDNKPKNDLNVE